MLISEHFNLVEAVEERLIYLSRVCDAHEFINECHDEKQWANGKEAVLEKLLVPESIDDLSLAKTR